MDCCNYMPHRHSYYGSSHYYENTAVNNYHPEYHQPPYSVHQYSAPTTPTWPFGASCSDYVYNPKEARIRKAMRERERTMGAAQMGSARSRRLNWPKTAVHMPGPGPNSHPEHLLGGPSKELCSVLRAEMEHGFLAGNSGYVYNPQQYSFSPQADYATYIQVAPGLSNWVQNYNMQQQGNQLAINQWNQYQNERLRAQQAAGTSYMMPPQAQAPEYQHVDMPSNNMMHMGPSLKPTIHQNIENAANEVERYININSTPTNMEVRSEPLPVEPPRRIANSTPIPAEPTETATNSGGDNVSENNTPPELNISSVTAMSEVDVQINMENSGSNSDSYGGMALFEDSNISDMKGLNSSVNSHMPVVHERKNSNSLPDFNQAFGSTERGRFQSPPDPRIGPEKEYLEYMSSNFPKAEQFNKWVDAANSFTASNYY